MFNTEGSFARKQLEKHGWTEGSGLGCSQQGMSQAIRVKIKQDTAGVGHDPVKEFSHHWWDHAFNKAVASIIVENREDGVVVKKKKITQKERSETAKKVLYGNFIKSSLLNNGTETKVAKEGEDSDSSEDETLPKVQTLMLPDEELLQACEGRTAHKGARHGLKLNGKLARIQEQDRLLAENKGSSSPGSPLLAPQSSQNGALDSSFSAVDNTPGTKRKKKSKKRKREEREDEHTNSDIRVQVLASEELDTPEQSEDAASVSKKKKKKRKKERTEDEAEEKKRRKKETDENKNNSVTMEMDSSCSVAEVKKRKKKSKTKSEDVCSDSSDTQKEDASKVKKQSKSSDVHNDNSSDAPENKKQKKRSKNRSAEVCSDSSVPQSKSKCEETHSDTSATFLNGTGSHSSADDELKEIWKKSKKKKKSKSVE